MTDSERKKILNKAKKAAIKTKSNTDVSTDNAVTSKDSLVKKNDDPFGLKFLLDLDHLAECLKFLKPLLIQSSDDLEVLKLASQVYICKSKFNSTRYSYA